MQSNSFGSLNFNFATGGSFTTVRSDLLNAANFGPGGTIPRSVNLLPDVPELTPAALATADVFVQPYMADFSPSETVALRDFIYNGGGFLFSATGQVIREVSPIACLVQLRVQPVAMLRLLTQVLRLSTVRLVQLLTRWG